MENSQLKDLQEEVSEATKQYILTTFNSCRSGECMASRR